MGLQWAEHTIEISATPDEVFDAITDYETFPEWQSAVLGTEVTETDRKTKLGEVVKYDVDGKIRTIHYTLRYHYDRPGKIWWDFVEGQGINTLDGGYEIVESSDGTSATYKVGIDVTGVPGPLLKRAHKGTIKKANEDLKAEAERRAGASPAEPVADGSAEAPAGDGAREEESITDAAMEVVESVGKLATVAGSRAIGAASKVLDGVGRRLMG
ncbi:MAG: SRPBCC family protein [Solirubrobacterales bacterium]